MAAGPCVLAKLLVHLLYNGNHVKCKCELIIMSSFILLGPENSSVEWKQRLGSTYH